MAQNPIGTFNPELCFNTAAGRICVPILTGPTLPYPPAPATPDLGNWTTVRNPQGEITRAASCFGSDELSFASQVDRNNDVTTKSYYLSSNGEMFLTLGGRAYRRSQGEKLQCGSKLSMFLTGSGIDYQMTISRESCTGARIVVELRGAVTETSVDFLEPKSARNGTEIGPCRALGERERERLQPFNDLLVAVGDFYWARAREEVGMLPTLLKNPGDGGVQASFWCGLARAGCWGLSAAGAASCCVGTAGTGCILCAGGFGAAGSACSEAWSWC